MECGAFNTPNFGTEPCPFATLYDLGIDFFRGTMFPVMADENKSGRTYALLKCGLFHSVYSAFTGA